MEVVDIKDRTPNHDLVALAERLLEKAKAGEIRSALVVYGWDDDSVSNGWAIDGRSNRRMILAEMTLAQHDFCVQISVEDGTSVLAKTLRGE